MNHKEEIRVKTRKFLVINLWTLKKKPFFFWLLNLTQSTCVSSSFFPFSWQVLEYSFSYMILGPFCIDSELFWSVLFCVLLLCFSIWQSLFHPVSDCIFWFCTIFLCPQNGWHLNIALPMKFHLSFFGFPLPLTTSMHLFSQFC